MRKLMFYIIVIPLLSACSQSTMRSINASLYADKSYKCTGDGYIFKIEGASGYEQGYIRVNESDRVLTGYQDSGIESRWFWGEYADSSGAGSSITKHRYKLVVSPNGAGMYSNSEMGTQSSLSCGALND